MLKLTLEYVNFDGQRASEDLYFNISQKALAEKEVRSNGTWFDSLQQISDAAGKNEADGNIIMDRFYEIIRIAYGERSEDGKYFRQSAQIWDDFESTAAFDAFFMKICTDASYATEFINAVLPQELVAAVKANAASQAQQNEGGTLTVPLPPHTPEIPTQVPPVTWPPQS